MFPTRDPGHVGLEPSDYTAELPVPTYDPDTGKFQPGAGGAGGAVVYADTPPVDPPVGCVFIDATGLGINPDGTR